MGMYCKIIGSCLGSNFVKSAANFVKKKPLLVAGGAGVAELIGYKAATSSRKQQTDDMNRLLYLQNPFLNPLGFVYHMLNPYDNKPNALDGPLVKYFVDRNNDRYQEYYDSLSAQDKIRELYKNGGKGVRFDTTA